MTERLTLALARPGRLPGAVQAEELAERGIEAALLPRNCATWPLVDALLSEDLLWESDCAGPDLAETAEGLNEHSGRSSGRPGAA
ncbi:MAG: hypothetical protein WKG07_10315 [Hymenobacter sp.]